MDELKIVQTLPILKKNELWLQNLSNYQIIRQKIEFLIIIFFSGETQLPQHLEQNRSASGSMRACENLLRNLMTQKIHRVSTKNSYFKENLI